MSLSGYYNVIYLLIPTNSPVYIEKQVNNTQIREKTEFGIKDLVIGMRNKFRVGYPEIFLRMNNLAEICFFCCKFRFIF